MIFSDILMFLKYKLKLSYFKSEKHKNYMQDGWRTMGKLYGFPDCCINEFVLCFGKRKKEIRKFCGTGYVPCLKCNEKSEHELLELIKARRICDYPFPDFKHHVDDNYKQILSSDKFNDKEKGIIKTRMEMMNVKK